MNFTICPICDEDMDREEYPDFKCPNGCCDYQIDPQADNVAVDLFNGTFFIVPLSEGSEFFPAGDDERFFEEVNYWREKEEGWNFKKNFPKLHHVIQKYKKVQTTEKLWYTAPVLEKMEKVERFRYLSMLLIAGDLPYEFNYNAAPCIKEFLETIKEKKNFADFKTEFNELDEILKEVFSMGERGVKDSTRSHPTMKKAENWTRNYENKGKFLLEIVENLSDEELIR